jgi:myo-inositol-1-phosphate synthase
MHIDTLVKIAESFEKISKNLIRNNVDPSKLEIHLIGGYQVDSKECYNEILDELKKMTPTIQEKVFEKTELSQAVARQLPRLRIELQKTEDLEEKKQLLSNLNAKIARECYTQISLNTQTGDISLSSDFEYLVGFEEPTSCKAYPKKSLTMLDELEVISKSDLKTREKIKQFVLDHEKPLIKVFDATRTEKNYF